MAEPISAFVARRKPDWSALEAALQSLAGKKLDLPHLTQLDRLYRVTTADLATAQTHYPNSDVHRFLNQLSSRAYGTIYRPRSNRVAAVRQFFASDFPQTVRRTMAFTRVSAALMAFGTLVGLISVSLSPEAAALLVSPGIHDFINRHELWTDVALNQQAPSEMATMIFTNNLRVTIAAFALGITGGVGTIIIMIFNGLSVGGILALCAQGGLLPGILTFMSAHGPVELSIISISGGAGLLMGHAMVVPGERPRSEALKLAALDAVKLVIGCAPFLTCIGIIEGFVSPGPLFPWWLKLPLGISLFIAFWSYLLRAGRPVATAA